MRLYAEGRARLWAFDFLGARDLLVKAVAADPDYPLAHSAVSEALWHLGYVGKARAEAQQALDLSQYLPQEEQLLVEGQYRRAIADWPKTVQTYQTLFHLFASITVCCWPRRRCISRRLTRCRRWRGFAIFLRRSGTTRALT